jgi:HlyD family secretion protein
VKPRPRWFLLATTAVVALSGCGGTEAPKTATAAVGRSTVAEVIEAAATVNAKSTVTLSSPANGTVEQLVAADGQQVRAGAVLLRIDSPSALSQLQQAEQADADAAQAGPTSAPTIDLTAQQRQANTAASTAFTAARAAAARIADPLQRAQAVAAARASEAQYAAAQEQTTAAIQQFTAGLGSLSAAVASLSQAQRIQTRAAVTAARRVVDSLVVRAPISGVVSFGGSGRSSAGTGLSGAVGSLPPELAGQASSLLGGSGGNATTDGQLVADGPVSSGQTVATITDTSALTLRADVDETDVLLVRRGVTADVELDAVPGARYSAAVVSVDLAPTASSRGGVTYTVRMSLGAGRTEDDQVAPTPRPGMSAVARLKVRTAKNALAVPVSAVFRDTGRDNVWVVTAGKAHRRAISIGAQGDDAVQVRSGLVEGDRVVIKGVDTVGEGSAIP